MHLYRDGQRQRSKILYLFRTPGGVRVGRDPLEPDVLRQIEGAIPDIAFNWQLVRESQQSSRRRPNLDAGSRATREETAAARQPPQSMPPPAAATLAASLGTATHPYRRRSTGQHRRANRVPRALASDHPRAHSASHVRSRAARGAQRAGRSIEPGEWTMPIRSQLAAAGRGSARAVVAGVRQTPPAGTPTGGRASATPQAGPDSAPSES
jgi:hypothetical protein